VLLTSDQGEQQGEIRLMFKGPYHVESLLRIPLIWRPAPSAGITHSEVSEPVGHVDLAPTFCRIAGIDVPDWMQGEPLPTEAGSDRQRVITTFDSQFQQMGMHLSTIYRDGFLCTAYLPRSYDRGGRFGFLWSIWGHGTTPPSYRGDEGELYDVENDPHQWRNLWNDPKHRAKRDELLADLQEHLPPEREPRLRVASPT
jgi:arylsulfatase A-like enzyme